MPRLTHGLWRYVVVSLVGLAAHIGLVPLYGADLRYYREQAQIALAGGNPFAHTYADFPPLKMWVFMQLERWNLWFPALFLSEVVLVGLIIWWVTRYYRADETALILALALYFGTAVFFLNWFATFEDKIAYTMFTLVLFHVLLGDLKVSSTRTALTIGTLTGLFTAYAGVGLVQFPIVWLSSACQLGISKELIRRFGLSLAAFAVVIAIGHLPFFPDWIEGYQHRLGRFALDPQNVSPFQLLATAGLYRESLPSLLTGLLLAIAAWKTLTGSDVFTGVALATFAVTAIRPENSYDMVLAAILPVMLLLLGNRAIALALVLIEGAVGYRVGYNDHPDNLKLILMWVGPTLALAWLVVRDVGQNIRLTARWKIRFSELLSQKAKDDVFAR